MHQVLDREQVIARPRAEVFAFFADAANLERLTPASLRFRIRGAPPAGAEMIAGTVIDYRLSLFGVPFSWRTLIEEFEPTTRFVDLQLKGPYRRWRHVHYFSDVAAGTLVRDRVEYELPFGPVGAWGGRRLVQWQLERIFDYRRDTLARIFAETPRPAVATLD